MQNFSWLVKGWLICQLCNNLAQFLVCFFGCSRRHFLSTAGIDSVLNLLEIDYLSFRYLINSMTCSVMFIILNGACYKQVASTTTSAARKKSMATPGSSAKGYVLRSIKT